MRILQPSFLAASLLCLLLALSLPARAVIELVILGRPAVQIEAVEQQLVTRVTAEEIEARGYTRLEQVLEAQPGLTTRSFGGAGSYSQLGIRGSTARQVAVYLDGVLVNSANGMPVDLSQFDLANVERIDIYRDLQPLEFDAPAVGGIVNIITRRDRRGGSLELGAGRYGERHAAMDLGWREGSWRHRLRLDSRAADNDYPLLNDNGTELNPYDDRIEPRHNAQTRSEGLQWFLRRDRLFDDRGFATADLEFRQSRQHVPDRSNDPLNTAWLGRDLQRLVLSLADESAERPWSQRLSLRDEQTSYRDLANRVGLDAQDNDYDSQRSEWQGQVAIGPSALPWDLGISFSLSREDYRSVQRLGSLDFRPDVDRYRRDRLSLGLRAARRLFDERLELVPLLRASIQRDQGPDLDETDRDWSFQLGWSRVLGEDSRLAGFVGRFTRQPSFSERYADHGFTVGNPGLRKETTDALSLTWRQDLADSRQELAVTGYLRHNRDLIVVSYDARGIGRYENIGASRVAGVELSWRGNRPDGFDWGLAWSLTGSRIDSDISAYDGGMLPNTPQQTLDLDLGGCLDATCRWRYWYRYHHARDAWYDSANLLPVADSNIQDIGIDYRRERWSLRLAINNLSDETREEFNGFPGPGRTWKASFNLKL